MGGRWAAVLLVATSACASAENVVRAEAPADPGPAPRWVDVTLGFEIEHPHGESWSFAPGGEAPEGILVPVVVVHEATGAQVMVQVAPQVARPGEFAERLAVGLRSRPGFTTSLPGSSERGASFRFALGQEVLGEVEVSEAREHLFVLLATWPASAPDQVVSDIRGIMSSLRTNKGAAVTRR